MSIKSDITKKRAFRTQFLPDGKIEYTEAQIHCAGMIHSLLEAGMDMEKIKAFMKLYFQIHFGANYETGTYGWTINLDTVKRSIDWQLKALQSDYIDFGFIHCIDETADLHVVEKNGIIQYIEELKKQGVVRHIGLSSHTPELVNNVLDMGILDMLMFSINPAYDYAGGSEANYTADSYAVGSVEERMNLYRRCETEGVGISVMKAFSGGQLLNAKTSPAVML